MNTAPALYVPSAGEITKVAASAAHRHHAIAGRIAKAAEILLSSGLQLDALAWDKCQLVRWRVASQSGKGAYVIVNGACPCEDSRHNGVSYCKHSIAAHLYAKVLRNHVNAAVSASQIDLGILTDGMFNAYAKGLGLVLLCKSGATYTFADAASMVRYAIWLASQRLPVAMPALTALAA